MPEPEFVSSARIAYDYSAEQYVKFAGATISPATETPLDRALLELFVEIVSPRSKGPVLDVGCGPGRVAAFLADRGVQTHGIDVSVAMIAAARRMHPHIAFDEGTLTRLPVDDDTAAGAIYWYSIIATPPLELHDVWDELDRVLASDGHVLLAFQAGQNAAATRPEAYGSSTTLTLYHHCVEDVAASLRDCGFEVRADIRREPELEYESTQQAFLFVRRSTEHRPMRRTTDSDSLRRQTSPSSAR